MVGFRTLEGGSRVRLIKKRDKKFLNLSRGGGTDLGIIPKKEVILGASLCSTYGRGFIMSCIKKPLFVL